MVIGVTYKFYNWGGGWGFITSMGIKVVEKMAISAPVGGKIRFHGANEAAGSPDFRTYFTSSLSQKLMRSFGFEILHVKCIV